MKYYLILSLAFLHSIPTNCNTAEKSSSTSRYKWAQTTKLHCKRFKCPPVEDFVCVRMRSKKIGSKTKDIYMLLINKCEMEYLKCHQGCQAAEVPMKNCGYHDKLGHSGKRVKRSLRKSFRKPIKRDSSGSVENAKLDGVAYEADPEDMNNDEENNPDQGVAVRAPETYDAEATTAGAKIYELNIGKEKETEGSPPDEDFVEKLDEPVQMGNDTHDQNLEGDDQIYGSPKEDNEKDTKADDETYADGAHDVKGDDKDANAHEVETADNQVTDDPNLDNGDTKGDKKGDTKSIDPVLPDDYDLNAANDGVDFEEYDRECPSICPAREVMICARCRDGIYRTFMSGCHLRMFNCDHPDEKAELVSRLPCVLSAPYLAEVDSPKGRVAEPGDVDEVMKFIRCREKAELGRDDPRCNIYNDDRRKKQLRN